MKKIFILFDPYFDTVKKYYSFADEGCVL